MTLAIGNTDEDDEYNEDHEVDEDGEDGNIEEVGFIYVFKRKCLINIPKI